MEVRGITRSYILRVDGGIDEPDGRAAVGGQLLIDEGNVTCPHRRCKTGPSVRVRRAGRLIGADVKREVGVSRNVWTVAKGGRAFVGRVDDA
jgi:hypothetical protein